MKKLGFLGLTSLASLALVAGCAADPAGDDGATSASQDIVSVTSGYTDIATSSPNDACKTSHEPGAEDIRGWRFDCGTMGGYTLVAEQHEELGTFPHVRTPTGTFQLDVNEALKDLTPYAVANGYFGTKAEWRGKGIAIGQVEPTALIVRYFWYDHVSAGTFKDRNALLVVKITPENACVHAVVSGALPNHNQTARDIADSQVFKDFNCPTQIPEPLPAARCGRLDPNTGLMPGEAVSSCSNSHSLVMQNDGNFVLYNNRTGRATWNTHTVSGGLDHKAIMRANGQLGVFNTTDTNSVFMTPETGSPGAWLAVQDDGNVVIYSKEGRAVWATGTQGK
ncbi:MAG: hypothetical protein U0270_14640 [Labilithrix sp.]